MPPWTAWPGHYPVVRHTADGLDIDHFCQRLALDTICHYHLPGSLQTMSDDLYDAAAVDGANAWQRLVYVTLPVLKPVLVVIIMLRSIFMFNKFDIVWLLTAGGPLTATEHLPILAYQRTFRLFDIGGGAAVATSIFIFDAADLALLQTVSHRGAWLDATLTMDDCTPCAAASPLWRCDHLFAVSHVLDGHFRAAGPTGAVSTAASARTLGVEKLRYDSAPDRFPTYYVNSIVVAYSTTLLTILVATPMAYAGA